MINDSSISNNSNDNTNSTTNSNNSQVVFFSNNINNNINDSNWAAARLAGPTVTQESTRINKGITHITRHKGINMTNT